MTGPDTLESISVIIPTYNREAALRRTLAGYLKQSSAGSIRELIIVDDGSTDGTPLAVRQFRQSVSFAVQYVFQPNRGPAAARNRGIELAQAPILLLADDDMIPHPNLIAQHLEFHRIHPEAASACLGRVKWSPEIRLTGFMKWYGECEIFRYRRIPRGVLDFRFFYSCNLSLKNNFLTTFGKFDERFKIAAYEDIELGFRLEEAGLQLRYNPKAITYHYQPLTFAEACGKKNRAESARRILLQTAAGGRLLQLEREREARPSFRAGRRIATWLGRAFPVSKLLDSRLPLPGFLYRSLLWYHARKVTEAQCAANASPTPEVPQVTADFDTAAAHRLPRLGPTNS